MDLFNTIYFTRVQANIEKWRNKMRQREKRKERREQRQREEQDKLVKLEEKKLSRREWLMAQPEVNKLTFNIQLLVNMPVYTAIYKNNIFSIH